MGFNRPRRRGRGDPAAPRALGCLMPLFWFVLLILLLGLIFGGYRKGTRVGAPPPPAKAQGAGSPSSGSAHGSAASHSFAN